MPENKTDARKGPFEFGIHPAVKMLHTWAANFHIKTGKTLEEWKHLVQGSGASTQQEQKAWLKAHFSVSSTHATWIVEIAAGGGWGDGTPETYLKNAHAYVDAMFAGAKENLKPIYEAIVSWVYELGDDVKACPCKTIIPLYRRHVFAQIKPATRNRLDLGLALGDMVTPPRLINTGGYEKRDRITHYIGLSTINEFDTEVKQWLGVAYQRDV
jgi:hypothetical protein